MGILRLARQRETDLEVAGFLFIGGMGRSWGDTLS